MEFSQGNVRSTGVVNPMFIPTINNSTGVNRYDKIKRDLIIKESNARRTQFGQVKLVSNPVTSMVRQPAYSKMTRGDSSFYHSSFKSNSHNPIDSQGKRFKPSAYCGYNRQRATMLRQKVDSIN